MLRKAHVPWLTVSAEARIAVAFARGVSACFRETLCFKAAAIALHTSVFSCSNCQWTSMVKLPRLMRFSPKAHRLLAAATSRHSVAGVGDDFTGRLT